MFGILLMPSLINTARADSQNVTTRWIVPADTTISLSFPNSESLITFDTPGMNFTNVSAKAQTGILAALRVTNAGNTAVKLSGAWTLDWPTGVTFVNISVTDDTNATKIWYTPANETSSCDWVASLAIGTSEDFWFWSSGANVAKTTGVDRTLTVTSTAV